MKQIRNLTSTLLTLSAVLGLVTNAAAQSVTEGSAKVMRIKGDARYATADSGWRPLKVGMILKPGTVVQTSRDPGSYVDLVLGDGESPMPSPVVFNPSAPAAPGSGGGAGYEPKASQNAVRVTENSALGIDRLTSTHTGDELVTDTQLDLKAGRIIGSVKKMSAASKYEVKLPNGVAGIRGTIYDLSADGVLRILIGSGVLAYLDAASNTVKTQVVNGSQQFDSKTGTLSTIEESAAGQAQAVADQLRFVSRPGKPETVLYDHTITPTSPGGKGKGKGKGKGPP